MNAYQCFALLLFILVLVWYFDACMRLVHLLIEKIEKASETLRKWWRENFPRSFP